MHEIKTVEGANWDLEIGALSDLNAKQHGPALLFDEITGYPKGYRVLTCMLGGPKRLSYVLGLDIASDSRQLMSLLEGKPNLWEEQSSNFPAKEVQDSPLFENKFVDSEVDLLKFPSPRYHEEDGGRYIGAGASVITKDPDSGKVNLGIYRTQVHNSNSLGLYMVDWHHGAQDLRKYHARGEPCPIAVSVGNDPLLFVASSMPVPYEISEYNYAGAIRGKPIEVVKGKITGLPIPATSEIAIEGFIYPKDLIDEGPFGEFTGYYVQERAPRPVIRAKALYHRNNPIIVGSPPGKPPHDYTYYITVLESAAIKDRLKRAGIPGVVSVWRHEGGCRYFYTVVSIQQQYAGHAKQAGLIAAGQRGFGRYVIVVDDDVDPTNAQDVIWALATRSDPATTIEIIHQTPSGSIDPMFHKKTGHIYGSRAIIIACKPYDWKEDFPKVVAVSKKLEESVRRKWPGILKD
jgi:UbiD family decarboxylase